MLALAVSVSLAALSGQPVTALRCSGDALTVVVRSADGSPLDWVDAELRDIRLSAAGHAPRWLHVASMGATARHRALWDSGPVQEIAILVRDSLAEAGLGVPVRLPSAGLRSGTYLVEYDLYLDEVYIGHFRSTFEILGRSPNAWYRCGQSAADSDLAVETTCVLHSRPQGDWELELTAEIRNVSSRTATAPATLSWAMFERLPLGWQQVLAYGAYEVGWLGVRSGDDDRCGAPRMWLELAPGARAVVKGRVFGSFLRPSPGVYALRFDRGIQDVACFERRPDWMILFRVSAADELPEFLCNRIEIVRESSGATP